MLLDSKLIVEQLAGRWRVKDAKLIPLWEEARRTLRGFNRWSADHVPRAQNSAADALANEAIDRVAAGGPASVVRRPGLTGEERPVVAASLAGTAWRAVSVAGASPVAGREPTITFDGGPGQRHDRLQPVLRRVHARRTARSRSAAVGMTMMACDDAVGQIEGAFTGALTAATTAAIDAEGRLHLAGTGGEIVLDPGPAAGGS